ncbi:MAG: hypothetical protein ACR2H3_02225 [Acidimicrobiales bacterium]
MATETRMLPTRVLATSGAGVGKFALGAVTVVLIISLGGQLGLPVLAPLHIWAARRSRRVGRVLWSVPVGLGTASYAWLIVYDRVGEVQPWIWLAPLAALVAVSWAMWWAGRPSLPRDRPPVIRIDGSSAEILD